MSLPIVIIGLTRNYTKIIGNGKYISDFINTCITGSLVSAIKVLIHKKNTIIIWLLLIIIFEYIINIIDLVFQNNTYQDIIFKDIKKIDSNTSLQFSPKCNIKFNNECGFWETSIGSGFVKPSYNFQILQNKAKDVEIKLINNWGVLIPKLSNDTFSVYGNGIGINVNCTSVSKICNLKARFGAMTSYNCPSTLMYANGNAHGELYNITILNETLNPLRNNNSDTWLIKNPILILTIFKLPYDRFIEYDEGFVLSYHRNSIETIFSCNIDIRNIKYSYTHGKGFNIYNTEIININPILITIKKTLKNYVMNIYNNIIEQDINGSTLNLKSILEKNIAIYSLSGIGGGIIINKGEGFYIKGEYVNVTVIMTWSIILLFIVLFIPTIFISIMVILSTGSYNISYDQNNGFRYTSELITESLTDIYTIMYRLFCDPNRKIYANTVDYKSSQLEKENISIPF
jgi:hypothetical protein